MAGTPQGLTHPGLNQVLKTAVEPALNRTAAAALTVAFEICKQGHLSRGEKLSDDLIKNEIEQIFCWFLGVTTPGATMRRTPVPPT